VGAKRPRGFESLPACHLLAHLAASGVTISLRRLIVNTVQLRGGIGFIWECDVHLFFRRSMHNQTLFGDGVHQRRKLAEVLIGLIGGAA